MRLAGGPQLQAEAMMKAGLLRRMAQLPTAFGAAGQGYLLFVCFFVPVPGVNLNIPEGRSRDLPLRIVMLPAVILRDTGPLNDFRFVLSAGVHVSHGTLISIRHGSFCVGVFSPVAPALV